MMILDGARIRLMSILLPALLIGSSAAGGTPDSTGNDTRNILTVGVFIGSIEEGARIFTPIRLLPFDHPESLGHEFPNALQLHQSEFDLIVWLGEQVGLKLKTTLDRYPKQPTDDWWYKRFRQIPVAKVEAASVNRLQRRPPIPGLRIAAFVGEKPVGFIVDTRGLTLEERGMERATAMGLDMTRQKFLDGLDDVRKMITDSGTVVVVFDK